jgi:uncharacterized protein YodC (DUF2158 family)
VDFNVGDVVRLKTGGPKMVLEDLVAGGRENPKAKCTWFDEKQARSQEFSISSLDRVRPKKNKDKDSRIQEKGKRKK